MAKRPVAPPRGMRDLLPSQVRLRDRCEAIIRSSYASFGFDAVETPALEHIELLTGGQGGDNEKLIYKVMKRGDKLDLAAASSPDELVDYGLRYDLTVPLARYYANNQGQLPTPFKALQIGSVWRAERPQKGRFRQFTQCDIDVLGEASIAAEVDLVAATTATLAALGLRGFRVRLNDRRLLSRLVVAAGFDPAREASVLVSLDKLDKLGAAGVRVELLSAGHAEAAADALLDVLGRGAEGLAQAAVGDDAAVAALADLQRLCAAFAAGLPGGGELVLDPTLVRGMGYYTGPVFEVELEGYGFSIAGGGRYDEMIGGLLGRPVPACGFSIGFERVVLVLEERGEGAPHGERVALLFDPQHDDLGAVSAAGSALRGSAQRVVSLLPARKNQGAQLGELQRHGFTHVVRFRADQAPELRPLGSD